MTVKNKGTSPKLKFFRYKNLQNWSTYTLLGNDISYTKKYRLEKIGNFMKRSRVKVNVKDDVLYKRPTIKLYGRGVKLRDELFGKDIGTKNQYLIKSGQFLISRIDARNGAFGIATPEVENAIATNDFLVFDVLIDKILPEYLELVTYTMHFQELCRRASSGSTGRQRVNENQLLEYEVPLPTIEEQKKIVSSYNKTILVSQLAEAEAVEIDNKIKSYLNWTLGIKNRKVEETKEGLQFVHFKDVDEWGVEKLLRDSDKGIKKFPTKKIGDICKISSGGTPSRARKEYYENGTIAWVKTGEVREEMIFDTEEKITELGLKNSSAKLYPKDSLIIAMYGATAGRSAKLGIDATTNQACAVLYQIDKEQVNTDYLWIYIQNEINNLKELATGSAQPNLNAEKISNFEVVLPPLHLQVEIVQVVNDLRNKIKILMSTASIERDNAKSNFEGTIFE